MFTVEELSKLDLKYIPVIKATKENTSSLGTLITDNIESTKDIPFYRGKVIEGDNFVFKYHESAVIRCARLIPREEYPINWIERHERLTQVFSNFF
jgi:hypothetical protein